MRGQEKDVGINIAHTNNVSSSGPQKRSSCMEQGCWSLSEDCKVLRAVSQQVMFYAQKSGSKRYWRGCGIKLMAEVTALFPGGSLFLR